MDEDSEHGPDMATIEQPLVLGPELAGALLTPEEFDRIEDWDEDYVYELVHGVLVVTPPPSESERGPNDFLGHLLRSYGEEHPQGKALNYTLTEHLIRTPDSRRRADRVIWAGLGRMPNVRRELPTIAIEFVSVGRRSFLRDYETKRDEYRKARIAEYWLIDRFRRQMTVFRQPSDPTPVLVVKEGETYTTPLLPGFELPLARLLAEADMLARQQEPEASD
jgi:Uma2 family endonuclease